MHIWGEIIFLRIYLCGRMKYGCNEGAVGAEWLRISSTGAFGCNLNIVCNLSKWSIYSQLHLSFTLQIRLSNLTAYAARRKIKDIMSADSRIEVWISASVSAAHLAEFWTEIQWIPTAAPSALLSPHQKPPVKCNFLQEEMNLAETFQNPSKWFGHSLLISINSKWASASPKCLWKSLTHFSRPLNDSLGNPYHQWHISHLFAFTQILLTSPYQTSTSSLTKTAEMR